MEENDNLIYNYAILGDSETLKYYRVKNFDVILIEIAKPIEEDY